MTEPDRFADWDAAYVLGSLTPQERHQYEDHLASCPDCREAVGELAGMPGLLSHLPPNEAMALVEDDRLVDQPGESGPELAMPESIARLRPPPTRPARARVLLAAAVVLALIAGGVVGYALRATGALPDLLPGASPPAVTVAFEPVHTDRMIAVADLAPDGGGTVIKVSCQYASSGGGSGHNRPYGYKLYVINNRGEREEHTAWSTTPGSKADPQLRSRLPISKINALEIVGESGDVLVRAAVR